MQTEAVYEVCACVYVYILLYIIYDISYIIYIYVYIYAHIYYEPQSLLYTLVAFHKTDWNSNRSFGAQWLLDLTKGFTIKIPRSAHTVYLCVLCGSQNKQRLFPYTALTDWFL
jgi:hypothetical protein